eukprot:scaffold272040_cov51-Attheya_sp.AAC.2
MSRREDHCSSSLGSLNKQYHRAHVDCISQWLVDHDDCPMCRANYLMAALSFGHNGKFSNT